MRRPTGVLISELLGVLVATNARAVATRFTQAAITAANAFARKTDCNMPSPEQLEELQKLLPQVATPETTLAVINGRAIAAKDLIDELKKMPTPDISSLIEDLKLLDKLEPVCVSCGKPFVRSERAMVACPKCLEACKVKDGRP